MVRELIEDVSKGALRGGRGVDVVGREGQALHHAQHLAQDHAVLRPQAPSMHRLRDCQIFNQFKGIEDGSSCSEEGRNI